MSVRKVLEKNFSSSLQSVKKTIWGLHYNIFKALKKCCGKTLDPGQWSTPLMIFLATSNLFNFGLFCCYLQVSVFSQDYLIIYLSLNHSGIVFLAGSQTFNTFTICVPLQKNIDTIYTSKVMNYIILSVQLSLNLLVKTNSLFVVLVRKIDSITLGIAAKFWL